jgi:hypothetical protein
MQFSNSRIEQLGRPFNPTSCTVLPSAYPDWATLFSISAGLEVALDKAFGD